MSIGGNGRLTMLPKIVTAQELAGLNLPPRNDVIPGIIPNGLTLLVSKPKIGKTWMTLGIAIAKADGGMALGKVATTSGNVLYLALEDGERRMQERLLALLNGKQPPANLEFAWTWPPIDQGGIQALEHWTLTRDNPVLVVMDTIKRLRPDIKQGKSLYDLDYEAIAPLADLSHTHHMGIVGNHHDRKLDADDILDVVSGTHGLTAACDTILVLQRIRTHSDAILHIMGRDVGESKKALSWLLPNWTLAGDADDYRMSDGRREILEFLRTLQEPIYPKDVAAMLDRPHNNIKVLMWKMAKNGDLAVVNGKYEIMDLKASVLGLGGTDAI